MHAWGSNQYGQIAQASGVTQKTTPFQVAGFLGGTVITAIAAGDSHSLAMTSDGKLYAFGLGSYGRLGTGTTTTAYAPVQSLTPPGVRAIAAGVEHSLAVLTEGSLYAFGGNTSGQLGTGGGGSASTPTRVTSLSGVVAIGAGGNHSLAVDVDEQVWAFGANNYGELGDGTTETRPLPTRVSDPDYTWIVGTPLFSPLGSTYTSAQNVTVTCATAGATIHYTTSGADPTTSDPTVASGGTVLVDVSLTLKARGFKTGLVPSLVGSEVYTLKVNNVTATPPHANPFNTPQSVSLTTTTPGVTIRYTTDGSTPTETSTVYTVPIAVGTTTSIRATGFRSGWSDSNMTLNTYTMKVGTPVLSPVPGTYSAAQTVTATTTSPGATLRYTLDGSPPTESSPIVPGGGVIVGQSAIFSVQGL